MRNAITLALYTRLASAYNSNIQCYYTALYAYSIANWQAFQNPLQFYATFAATLWLPLPWISQILFLLGVCTHLRTSHNNIICRVLQRLDYNERVACLPCCIFLLASTKAGIALRITLSQQSRDLCLHC
jgi:hypothetical protein